MRGNAERRNAHDRVPAYHEACLKELIEHLARALDSYRADDIDAFGMDEAIHQYHRTAKELWKFCWIPGGTTQLEFVAETVNRQALEGHHRLVAARHTATIDPAPVEPIRPRKLRSGTPGGRAARRHDVRMLPKRRSRSRSAM
jgi:hypothetical protein